MRLMYINGAFTKGRAQGEIEVTNSATEEVLDAVPRGTAEDVESAVRSSKVSVWAIIRVIASRRRSNLLAN
jgi:acyl-CoA reductase-like NAD-dependent aldehyde dehydrogenase